MQDYDQKVFHRLNYLIFILVTAAVTAAICKYMCNDGMMKKDGGGSDSPEPTS